MLPEFCLHCQIIGHYVANCRWFHPDKERRLVKDYNKKVHDKGKKVIVQKKPQTTKWPARENPLGIGSSLAFEKSVVNSETTATVATSQSDAPTHDVAANTFSFSLQNVSDAIPQGLLPQPVSPVLE